MQVIIMYRNSYDGGDGWKFYPKTIEIDDYCQECGEKRGKPYAHTFHECGEWYGVNRWDNPCGHIDTYKDVWHESQNLEQDIPECFGTHQVVDIG